MKLIMGTASRLLVVLLPLVSVGQTPAVHAPDPTLRLRIEAAEIQRGVPHRIAFVFTNLSDHEVRIPPVSPCVGQYSGRIALMLKFTPFSGRSNGGVGGGCGAGVDHVPPILEQAKNWKVVPPHDSYKISFKTSELFINEEPPGIYEFWGEYYPPPLTTENVATLQKAGIAYPQGTLVSERLRFTRPE